MPNGDLAEMKQEHRRSAPQAAGGMLYGSRELAEALREMGIGAATAKPDPWWKPWTQPAIVILLVGVAGGAFWQLRDAVIASATNREAIAEVAQALKDISGAVAETTQRQAALDKDISSRRASIDTWRSSIEDKVRPVERLEFRLGAAEGRNTEIVSRIDRIAELWQKAEQRANATATDIAVIKAMVERLEARNRGAPPFLESPTWKGRPPPRRGDAALLGCGVSNFT